MNDTNSNIEIINFDYSVNDEQNQNESGSYPHENFNKDYLNLYLMEKSGLDNEQNDSLDIYQPSFSYTNQPNDSFSSYYSNDGLSCFSESLTLNPPNPLNNETCDKSFCASVDNCNGNDSLIKAKQRKSFTCSFKDCEKVYKSKENLTLHYRNIHLKEKPYSCKYCSAVFSHRNGKFNLISR
jgi:hypothetical protein